ncbi:MAG TPA: hypothetical protein P5079_01725 [Elusimicrobiota bacterium]|nr:hypothetical protein [Elusimicrobiota bacterium]
MIRLEEFYAHPAVRERLAEYCGGRATAPDRFTAHYLVGYGSSLQSGGHGYPFESFSLKQFDDILDRGCDMFRSVWDHESTLGVLDLEYVNPRRPGEIFRHPRAIFEKIEPIYRAVQKVLYRFNITPLAILTGQGYHFTFRVRQDSAAHRKLEGLGQVNGSLGDKYRTPRGRRRAVVGEAIGRSFDGMGRLMEYVGHLVLRELRKQKVDSPVLTFTDVAVGGAGESVSLDFSMYGDPLYMRDIRCPFSGYQKHKVQVWKVGEDVARQVPIQVALPRITGEGRSEWALEDILARRGHYERSAELASACRTDIPDVSHSVVNLIDSYTRSALYRFHLAFDAEPQDPPERWPQTYDFFDSRSLPPCVAHCLATPNDHLLKPTNLQALVRVLMKRGWHPKHIAGLVRSKYEKKLDWNMDWAKYDPATHANFFVRQFAGLLATGLDTEADLNCVSHQEKGYCWKPFCGHNLADERLPAAG